MPARAPAPTVTGEWVTTLAGALEIVGFPARDWLARRGYGAQKLGAAGARVPVRVTTDLWRTAGRATGDPYLGLHVGEAIPTGAPNIFISLALSSPSLGETFRCFERYQRLFSTSQSLSVRGEPSHVAIVLHAGSATPFTPHQVDLHFFTLWRIIDFCGGPGAGLIGVELERTAPSDAEHRRIFRAPIAFGRRWNALLVARETLSRTSPFANASTFAVLRAEAERQLEELGGPSWHVRARAALVGTLGDEPATLAAVAQRLGVAPRSLQRHLASEGVVFAEILDELRRERALDLAADERLTARELSEQLGFSDARSFHRAFRRWTRGTLSSYRARPRRSA